MDESSAEYDAFGPWVLPVSSPSQVPPVFRAHPIDFTRSHDVLKVPRNIARRDVTPRSHLYDQLLVLDQDGLEVLTRRGHRFTVQRIAHRDVLAIDSGTELLDGWLIVLGVDGERIEVSFNGSSLPLITAFAERLAGWFDGGPAEGAGGSLLEWNTLGIRDIGLVNSYNTLAQERLGVRVATAYPGRTPVSQRSRIQQAVRGVAHLSGAVVCSDGDDMVVLARRNWVQHSKKPDLSQRRIIIQIGLVSSVASSPHPFLDDTVDLTVVGGAARLDLSVPAGDARAVSTPIRTPSG